MQLAALAPMGAAAGALGQVLRQPWHPLAYLPHGAALAEGLAFLEDFATRPAKPVFGLDRATVRGQSVAVIEETVLETAFCRLIRFRRQGVKAGDPKLLVLAPLSGHHATLLRDTVAALLPAHEVMITDWIDARDIPLEAGAFGLDDYIAFLLDLVRRFGPDLHVMAVCQPAVPALAAVALLAEDGDPAQPRSLILMGGPIDSRVNPTEPNRAALRHDRADIEGRFIQTVPFPHAGAGRRVFPGFLQLSGFVAMNLDRHLGAQIELFKHLVRGDGDGAARHRRFYQDYLAVMDLPAEYYLETIETVFRNHDLPLGRMVWHGRPVRPAAIRKTALLTVEGEKDDISAPGQTRAAHDLCARLKPGLRAHHLQPRVGHFGLFNGRRWREEILPVVARFIRTHQG
jgi:poly(3-hydroxybutyrate) depolymerase